MDVLVQIKIQICKQKCACLHIINIALIYTGMKTTYSRNISWRDVHYMAEQTWQWHWASCHETVRRGWVLLCWRSAGFVTCKQTDRDQGHALEPSLVHEVSMLIWFWRDSDLFWQILTENDSWFGNMMVVWDWNRTVAVFSRGWCNQWWQQDLNHDGSDDEMTRQQTEIISASCRLLCRLQLIDENWDDSTRWKQRPLGVTALQASLQSLKERPDAKSTPGKSSTKVDSTSERLYRHLQPSRAKTEKASEAGWGESDTSRGGQGGDLEGGSSESSSSHPGKKRGCWKECFWRTHQCSRGSSR